MDSDSSSTMDEQTNACGGKRRLDVSYETEGHTKIARMDSSKTTEAPRSPSPNRQLSLKPAPYFYYKNCSHLPDPDPLTPLTGPGRVPTFPARMHAILSRPDLADIVAWMPHGRSWRVLKPREFEIRVIPTYFEHAKFSSFIRQANGWGFRRITQGRDRNSYYNELFVRGLPHLCKHMKRPNAYEKQATNPEHEPDLYKISMEHPVPEKAALGTVLLDRTLQAGPKARMPVHFARTPPPALTFASAAFSIGQPVVQANFYQQRTASALQQPSQHYGAPAGYTPVNQPVYQQPPSSIPLYSAGAIHQNPFQAAPSPQFTASFAAATALAGRQQFANFLGHTMTPFGHGG